MKLIQNSVVAAKGFKVAGEYVGIKKQKKDMAVVYSETSCTFAGAFTQNKVKAAPVLWDEMVLTKGNKVHAVIINSGNANAVTGKVGEEDTAKMAQLTAEALGIQQKEVLVASTGVIGVHLPMDKIADGIGYVCQKLDTTAQAAMNCAEAILTTDTFIKEIAIEDTIGGVKYHIGAIGKGSGMIHPNMATMLSFVTTDIAISKEMLQKALIQGVNTTFNMITVDGDTSTNDSVIVLANGEAKNQEIIEEGEAFELFCASLYEVLKYVALSIVKDGEGATKLLEVKLKNVDCFEKGKTLAKSILTSNLVKTAFFGEDANWGRILAAMGYAGVDFEPNEVTLEIESGGGKEVLFKKGVPIKFNEARAKKVLEDKEIQINIDMNEGHEEVTAWGCDLSYEYVRINGEYRS